jgi:hypothetical protein
MFQLKKETCVRLPGLQQRCQRTTLGKKHGGLKRRGPNFRPAGAQSSQSLAVQAVLGLYGDNVPNKILHVQTLNDLICT